MAVRGRRAPRALLCVICVELFCFGLVSSRGVPGEIRTSRGHGAEKSQPVEEPINRGRRRKPDLTECTGDGCTNDISKGPEKAPKHATLRHEKTDDVMDRERELPVPVEFGVDLNDDAPMGSPHETGRRGHKNRKSKRRRQKGHRRRNKHIRDYAASSRDKYPASDPRADLATSWSSPRQLPEVARLEQRLHPNLERPIRDLGEALHRLFRAVRYSVRKVEHDYSYVFNTTRYDIMLGVRSELLKISEENNKAYGAVMEASLLTKDVYRRAHQQRLTGPRTRQDFPSPHGRGGSRPLDLYGYEVKVREEERQVQLLNHRIANSRRQREAVSADFMRLQRNVEEKLPLRALLDLGRHANQTMTGLARAMPNIDFRDDLHLQLHGLNIHGNNVRQARNLTRDAKEAIFHAKNSYSTSKNLLYKVQNALQLPERPETRGVVLLDVPFDDARMMLWATVDGARMHADDLVDLAIDIQMTFKPLLIKAKETLAKRDTSYITKRLEEQARKLRETIKHLKEAMETIYTLLGVEVRRTEAKTTEKRPCGDGELEGSGEIDDCVPNIDVLEGSGIDIEGSGFGDDDDLELLITDGNSVASTTDKDGGTPILEAETTSSVSKADTLSLEREGHLDRSSPAGVPSKDETSEDATLLDAEERPGEEGGDLFFVDLFGFTGDDPDAGLRSPGSEIVTGELKINELVRHRLQNLTAASRLLGEQAMDLRPKIEEVSSQWKKTITRFTDLANSTDEARSFVRNVAANRQLADASHDLVIATSERINLMRDVVGRQCSHALELVERKLKSVEARRQSQDTGGGGDLNAEDVHDTRVAVQTAVENVREISRLQRVHPEPGRRAETLERRIRSNITALREKILQAKTLAASLQMPVSLKGSGYLHIPVERDDRPKSLTTSMDMMVKTSNMDGPIASLETEDYGLLVVSVKDRYPAVTVLDGAREDQGEITSDFQMEADTWYQLSVQRVASMYQLSIRNGDGSVSFDQNVTIDEEGAEFFQPHPSSAFFGGLPDEFPQFGSGYWQGCIGHVTVNGDNVGLLSSDSAGNKPTICSATTASEGKDGIILGGQGYGKFAWSVTDQRGIDDLQLTFTSTSDGILFYSKSLYREHPVLLYVQDKHLMVEIQRSKMLRSVVDLHHSLQNHVLQIRSLSGRAEVTLNGDSAGLSEVRSHSLELVPDSVPPGIYIGGVPLQDNSVLSPMAGCLSEFQINSVPVPISIATSLRDVSTGSCGDLSCVSFGEDSLPISYPEVTGWNHLRFSFQQSAVGTILHYSKTKKFDLELRVDTDGVDIMEHVTDTSERLEFDEGPPGRVIFVTVDDPGVSVKISVDGVEASIEYDGGWFASKFTDKDEYSLSIGGTQEGSDGDGLEGRIYEFVANNRLIDFKDHFEDHQLSKCPAPRERASRPSELETPEASVA